MAAAPDAWTSAPVGQRFELGDAVRTGEASTARLRVGASGGVRMQPSTILRFLGERPDAHAGVRLEAGDIELETDEAIALETELGSVTLQAGARVRARSGDASRVEVVAGRVVFEDEGETRTAEAGSTILLAVGRVVFEDETTLAAAPPEVDTEAVIEVAGEGAAEAEGEAEVEAEGEAEAEAEEEPEAESGTGSGSEAEAAGEVEGGAIEASPARFHVSVPAGETATIHDAAAPTVVRIDFGSACAGRGVVTLRSGRRRTRFAGEGSAIVTVPVGRTTYGIDCAAAGRDPRGGALTVRRDDGSQRLDPVPPRNVVDTDGRTYDVLYQNALPILTVRWREGGGGAATLHLASGGRERAVPAPGGRVELRSGELAEGTHRLWFTAGGRTSPSTTLRIRFDNAAPAASLREPGRAATLQPGQRVRVAGVVLAGFEVRAEGTALPIDGQMRFASEVPVPTDHDALVVRFSHPRRGVHYYLRRVAGR